MFFFFYRAIFSSSVLFSVLFFSFILFPLSSVILLGQNLPRLVQTERCCCCLAGSINQVTSILPLCTLCYIYQMTITEHLFSFILQDQRNHDIIFNQPELLLFFHSHSATVRMFPGEPVSSICATAPQVYNVVIFSLGDFGLELEKNCVKKLQSFFLQILQSFTYKHLQCKNALFHCQGSTYHSSTCVVLALLGHLWKSFIGSN